MSGYVTHADLGGTTGHGPIERESEGVVFHHEWEAKTLALTLAAGAPGGWNIDMSRAARETLPNYADLTYFEIWTAGLERLLVDSGAVTAEEIETFDIRDKGWHLIAIKAHEIGGAERFPLRGDEDDYAERLLTYQNAIVTYYGDDAQIFAAYHQDGMLVEWHFLSDFRPAPRHF